MGGSRSRFGSRAVGLLLGLVLMLAGCADLQPDPGDQEPPGAPAPSTAPEESEEPEGPPPEESEEPEGSEGVGEEPSEESPTESACGPFPQFPDEDCTGWRHTGVELRECPTTVTEPNAQLDGCRFPGGVTIDAPNVTITRSLIEGMVEPHANLQNLTLIDVEIDGSGRTDPHSQAAIGNNNYTCVRCHIHGTGRGANLGRNVHIEDSYLHGFPQMGDNHLTAIGSNGGGEFTIVHNNLECDVPGCSAALSLYGDFAPVDDVLIQHNLFNTTGSYCTYGGSVQGKPYPVGTNIRYLDNRFGKKFLPDCGAFGPVASWKDGGGNVWQGNEWQDGSGPVTP